MIIFYMMNSLLLNGIPLKVLDRSLKNLTWNIWYSFSSYHRCTFKSQHLATKYKPIDCWKKMSFKIMHVNMLVLRELNLKLNEQMFKIDLAVQSRLDLNSQSFLLQFLECLDYKHGLTLPVILDLKVSLTHILFLLKPGS